MNSIIYQELKDVINDSNVPWNSLNDKSVLVTGSTGLLGSLIVYALCLNNEVNKTNTKIYACCRNLEKAKNLFMNENVIYVQGDITDSITVNNKVDYIIHTASITSSKTMVSNPVETMHVSINGTQNILEFARKNNIISFIYLSSMEVYGITSIEQNPIIEDKLGYISLSEVRSSYSESKRVCELLCNCYSQQYGMNIRIARLAQTFGPGINISDNRMPIQFAKSIIRNENIVLHTDGKSVSNFCYVYDALRAIFIILLRGHNSSTYNVCNDAETCSVLDIAQMVTELGKNSEVEFDIPDSNEYGYAPPMTIRLCSDKLKALGWNPQVSLKEAYRRLIQYLNYIYESDT